MQSNSYLFSLILQIQTRVIWPVLSQYIQQSVVTYIMLYLVLPNIKKILLITNLRLSNYDTYEGYNSIYTYNKPFKQFLLFNVVYAVHSSSHFFQILLTWGSIIEYSLCSSHPSNYILSKYQSIEYVQHLTNFKYLNSNNNSLTARIYCRYQNVQGRLCTVLIGDS